MKNWYPFTNAKIEWSLSIIIFPSKKVGKTCDFSIGETYKCKSWKRKKFQPITEQQELSVSVPYMVFVSNITGKIKAIRNFARIVGRWFIWTNHTAKWKINFLREFSVQSQSVSHSANKMLTLYQRQPLNVAHN